VVTRAGLLDFLTPVAGKTMKKPARTAELVDQLLDLTRGTEAGLKASASRKEEIEELVDELSEYCMRSPLRSDLIFGEWEVVYASKPQTAGGPFRSPIGRAVFPGQRATQVIAEPNVCINEVSYKALGFVPGSARQEGEIEPVDETTFQITFPGQVGKKTGGPPTRLIEVAYLDERIRVAKALPQNEGDEGSFYVFVRVAEDEEEEEEEEEEVVVVAPAKQQKSRARAAPVANDDDDDEEEDAKPRGKLSLPSFDFGSQMFKKSEGRATQAERSVAARGGQVNQTRGGRSSTQSGTQIRGGGKVAAAPAAPARKSREELAAERATAKAAADEARREAAAAAAAARAEAEEDRRRAREEAAEEKRRAQAAAQAGREESQKRQVAARESYQELAAAATEAANEAKEAAAAYKSAEREASSLLRAAAQARSIISKAVEAADQAASQLLEAQSEEVYLEKEVLGDQRLVNQLEKKLREVSAAIAPRISKK
jgi:chemotaxis protein histidine kinase CheA